MLDHAFGPLGLHRIALFVFEFNERAIRTYQRCGFVIEGRARESIFRDGRWWDELAMSVLESDWRRLREAHADRDEERASLRAEAEVVESVAELERDPVGARSAGRSLFKRTVRRFS
jgi:ribosomal protein S18 acetylase RimI-like enzyme